MSQPQLPQPNNAVDSLLDSMKDGNEYGSIVSLVPKNPELIGEIRRGIKEIEIIRKRPCVVYVANVIKPFPTTEIDYSDDLPFNEMIDLVQGDSKAIDVFLVTPGGLGQQVSQFVNTLRGKFDEVDFLLPFMCMSAGTLWALAGDRIWMDKRSYIGPIDPQVRDKSGQLVPAQSILLLLKKIQDEGQTLLDKGKSPPWAYIRLVDSMDHRQIGAATSMSNYSIQMATDFLEKYKFRTWKTDGKTGNDVTATDKHLRAEWIASELCSNERWKSHGHGITREVANSELKLLIDKPESAAGFERAIRRLWALFYYIFDKAPISKAFVSEHYSLVRNLPIQG